MSAQVDVTVRSLNLLSGNATIWGIMSAHDKSIRVYVQKKYIGGRKAAVWKEKMSNLLGNKMEDRHKNG
jgi:hypothetical protein